MADDYMPNEDYRAIIREIEESNEAIMDLERARGIDPDEHPELPVIYRQGDEELREAILRHQRALNASRRAIGLPEAELIDPETWAETSG